MSYEVGQSASRSKTFTDEDVRTFAHVSTDTNPIHLDADYAANTMFGQRIVHGMLTASLISAVLANDFPGPGTIYLGQELKFTKPVLLGDTITATVTVTKFREDKGILTLETVCANQDGDTVIKGEAVVKVP
jgi:3-hydroxybutyryl-CoA dehydratase